MKKLIVIALLIVGCQKEVIVKDCTEYQYEYFKNKQTYEELVIIYNQNKSNKNKFNMDKAKENMDKSKKSFDECQNN